MNKLWSRNPIREIPLLVKIIFKKETTKSVLQRKCFQSGRWRGNNQPSRREIKNRRIRCANKMIVKI